MKGPRNYGLVASLVVLGSGGVVFDPCTAICFLLPVCGRGGSWCKSGGHACHDLFIGDSKQLCSRTADPGCDSHTVLSCDAAASHWDQASLLWGSVSSFNASDLISVATLATRLSEAEYRSFTSLQSHPYRIHGTSGFRNVHNTCYLAASLQLLTHIKQLRDWILPLTVRPIPALTGGETYMREIVEVFRRQWLVGRPLPIDLSGVLNVLAEFRGYGFQVGEMEDAHDAVRTLLGIAADSLRRSDGTSPIESLFRIVVGEVWTCSNCGEIRHRNDTVDDLFLTIPDETNRVVSLAECIGNYVASETVEGVACGQHVCDAVVNRTFAALPDLLLVTLKRFRPDGSRINAKVQVSSELDFSTLPGGGTGKYTLRAVVHHIGRGSVSGHYTTDFVHPDIPGQHFSADVTSVKKISSFARVGVTPYILLYDKRMLGD